MGGNGRQAMTMTSVGVAAPRRCVAARHLHAEAQPGAAREEALGEALGARAEGRQLELQTEAAAP